MDATKQHGRTGVEGTLNFPPLSAFSESSLQSALGRMGMMAPLYMSAYDALADAGRVLNRSNGYGLPFEATAEAIVVEGKCAPALKFTSSEDLVRIVLDSTKWPVGFIFDRTIHNGPWEIPVASGELKFYDFKTGAVRSLECL